MASYLKKFFDEYRACNARMESLRSECDRLFCRLKEKIQTLVSERFPSNLISFFIDFNLTDGFYMQINSIDSNIYTSEGWFKKSEHSDKIYRHLLTKTDFSDSFLNDLNSLTESIQKEFGIDVNILSNKIDDNPEVVYDFEGLKVIYGLDIEEIESGHIWYSGWDIPDPYVIFEDNQKRIHIQHGEGAHGGGLRTHVGPGDKTALERFFEMSEEINLRSLRMKYEYRILLSWK